MIAKMEAQVGKKGRRDTEVDMDRKNETRTVMMMNVEEIAEGEEKNREVTTGGVKAEMKIESTKGKTDIAGIGVTVETGRMKGKTEE